MSPRDDHNQHHHATTTTATPPPAAAAEQRFAPLGINKDSHVIQKPNLHFNSPNPNITSNDKKINGIINGNTQQLKQPQQRRQPVIIYTHSPTVLHVTPDGFKDLVQRLTGMPRREEENQNGPTDSKPTPSTSQTEDPDQGEKVANQTAAVGVIDHDYYPSVRLPANNGMIHPPPVVNPVVFDPPPHGLPPLPPQMTFLPDPTLYAPSSSDFFTMPNMYGYPTDVFTPTNMNGGDCSSGMIDQMKNFQEY